MMPTDSSGGAPANNMRQVYLDYAAATPMDRAVVEAMTPYLCERFENPSAPYARARRVRADYEAARARLARLIGSKADNVVMTAGATEANNLALGCVTGEVVASAIEHESVLACVGERGGSVLGVAPDGTVDPKGLARAITPATELVSIALANGEIGTVQPMRELAKVVAKERDRRLAAGEKRPIYLHTDASQAAGSRPINVSTLRVDLLTLSAAKVYGPKQVGLLWAADGVRLRPLVLGGGQESGLRSGTENVAGVVAFAEALCLAQERCGEESARLGALRDGLEKDLLAEFPWMWVSGPSKARMRLPGLLHVSFPSLEARRLVVLLERMGVSVGTGSACAASKMRVSHVLSAIGVPEEVAKGSLRITLGRPTSEDDVRYALDAISRCVRSEMARLGLGEQDVCELSARLRGGSPCGKDAGRGEADG